MYQIFRFGGAGATAAADETGPEIADAGSTAGAEGGGTTLADGPEGLDPVGVDTLTEELLPESISRFNRFRSPRISDATW
jgi:hypothetical protein